MIDEKKVALMTKLAIFEKHESSDSLVLSKYYKSDYVRYNMLKALIASTVVYWAIIAAYVFMKFDQMLADINKLNYFDLIYKVLAGYVVVLVVFFLFSSMVYSYRYYKARPGLTKYNSNLKKLIELEGGNGEKVGVVVNDVLEEERPSFYEKPIERTPEEKAEMARRTVSRTALVRQSQEREDKVKQQQIIDNINQRNARIAAQNDAKLRQQQQREYDRQMIMERRRQLEQAQMQQRRTQTFQQMQSTTTNKMEGSDK